MVLVYQTTRYSTGESHMLREKLRKHRSYFYSKKFLKFQYVHREYTLLSLMNWINMAVFSVLNRSIAIAMSGLPILI